MEGWGGYYVEKGKEIWGDWDEYVKRMFEGKGRGEGEEVY